MHDDFDNPAQVNLGGTNFVFLKDFQEEAQVFVLDTSGSMSGDRLRELQIVSILMIIILPLSQRLSSLCGYIITVFHMMINSPDIFYFY